MDIYFTQEKLENRIRTLEQLRYCEMEDIFPFMAGEDVRDIDTVVKWPPQIQQVTEVEKHTFLTGRDRYYWLWKEVTLPAYREGFRAVGLFDMGKTGAGTNSGFESLLYVNEEVYQAVDSNHKEVFFKKEEQGRQVRLDFLLWSGLEGGGPHQEQIIHVKEARMGYMHVLTDEFYFLGKAIFKTLRMMDDRNEEKEALMAALDRAVMQLDISGDRHTLYRQTETVYPALVRELEAMGKRSGVTVHCVGHTHIDVAWLWRLKNTAEKAQRSFATVLRYMEEFEEYQFVQSQPQLYQFVKENNPSFYEKLKKCVETGRFEPEGAMWVEADCNISSGESLTRQIMEGNRFFEEEFGKRSSCLWLPDVFGYSVALPQIMKLCNINRFVTTKISWNEYNKMPHDTFYWKGLDGSQVLTYFITTPEEGRAVTDKYATYNGQISPRTVIGSWRKYEDKDVNKDILLTYGYGDGGGGPTRTMLMMRRALEKVPGIPHVRQTGVKAFLDIVEENLKKTDRPVGVWEGELYLENHRGTYTSQGRNKRYNRKLEFALTRMEAQSVFSLLAGKEYEKERLLKLWRCLLLNQFHDIIPGSSIHEVYLDSYRQYQWMETELDELEDDVLSGYRQADENVWHVFNPLSFARSEAVELPVTTEGNFYDAGGKRLRSQRTEGGCRVQVDAIPLGYTQIYFRAEKAQPEESLFYYDGQRLETPYYRISRNQDGILTGIYDKKNGREVLRGYGNRLTVYEDRPYNNDAWNIDLFHRDKYEVISAPEQVRVIENGPLRFCLESVYRYQNSVIVQRMICYADTGRIDFETKADWHEEHRLLKTDFLVDIDSRYAQYDVQYGNVERPTHYNTTWDCAKFEVAAQKWADYGENGYGAALLNDCKYGYSIHESRMSLSLIKCATFPDTQADQGEHLFTYAFLPHADSWQQAGVEKEALALNQPLRVYSGENRLAGKSLFRTMDENIVMDAVKKAEAGEDVVIRFHEYFGRRGNVKVTSDFPVERIQKVNLLEDGMEEEQTAQDISVSVRPYEICTYRVVFGKGVRDVLLGRE